jgi:uncharacterized protein (TIGR00369 family)
MPRLTLAELETLMDGGYPDWRRLSVIETIGDHDITMRMPYRKELTRFGGTISGPAMMALADTAAYFLIMVHLGAVQAAVTSSLDIHFLSRPEPTDVIATATMLKLGKRLAVTAVLMRSAGQPSLVAHAIVTYALPR